MLRTFLASAVLFAASVAPVSAASVATPQTWTVQRNDVLIVDIQSNTGYLVHEDATYLPFLVATGVKKTVHYLNQTYYAQTPVRYWVAKERKIQPDLVNFGVTGRFLRLFQNGTTRTAYGIHSHKNIQAWLQQSDRYRSLGCIVVSEEILNIIEQTYFLNGQTLTVITTDGPKRLLDELSARERPYTPVEA